MTIFITLLKILWHYNCSSHPTVVTVQLGAAQVGWIAGEISAAYLLLYTATTNHAPECLALEMPLKIDHLDLEQKFPYLQRLAGDDSVLVELAGINIALATGRSKSADAIEFIGHRRHDIGQFHQCCSQVAGLFA